MRAYNKFIEFDNEEKENTDGWTLPIGWYKVKRIFKSAMHTDEVKTYLVLEHDPNYRAMPGGECYYHISRFKIIKNNFIAIEPKNKPKERKI